MKFLVTGSAGFIGYHVSKRLLTDGYCVVGLDNLNTYYDISLKLSRLNILKSYNKFVFYKCDLYDRTILKSIFLNEKIDRVIHFAAQSGVRFSLQDPMAYINSNIIGYFNILEECRLRNINHLVYASSSSVYGLNSKLPFSVVDTINYPSSLYGVSKRTNELMSYTYSHLYQLPTTGLRLFTVYGPWGRPDMVIFKFTKAMLDGESIDVYNYGRMKRSFTFIEDVVEVIIRIQNLVPVINSDIQNNSTVPYSIYNVANDQSIGLMTLIQVLEEILGVNAKKNLLPMQLGDVLETIADESTNLYNVIQFYPKTSLFFGIQEFVNWYRNYYQKFK